MYPLWPMLALILGCLTATASVAASAADLGHSGNLEGVLRESAEERFFGDLPGLKARGVLRVLTRNNSSNYFILRGGEWGFQFELVRAFAEELGLRLEMVVHESRSGLIPALLEGEGDLIAAGTTVTATRAKLVRFTPSVQEFPRVIATHPLTVKPLRSLEDLPAFRLWVNFRSTTYAMALDLEAQLETPLLLHDVPAGVEMEEMLRRVGRGEYEATIVDENLVDLEAGTGAEVASRLQIGPPLPHAWATRPSAIALGRAAASFIERSRKNGLIRVLYQKYFKPEARLAQKAKDFELRADEEGRLSPFDEHFRRVGREVGIDWRLLAAVAFAESRFDPEAESAFGAHGLMQVRPSTAKEVAKLSGDERSIARRLMADAALNIQVGGAYLAWLMARFDPEGVDRTEQIRFALAAYNVGLGHIRDARALARLTGRDPDKWFGAVEDALRLKEWPRWHARTRFGYCRPQEPIDYVNRVQAAYELYARHVPFE